MAGKDGGGRVDANDGSRPWDVCVIARGDRDDRIWASQWPRRGWTQVECSKQARKHRLLHPRESRHSRMQRSIPYCNTSHALALFGGSRTPWRSSAIRKQSISPSRSTWAAGVPALWPALARQPEQFVRCLQDLLLSALRLPSLPVSHLPSHTILPDKPTLAHSSSLTTPTFSSSIPNIDR